MPTTRNVGGSKNIGDPINSRRIDNKIDLLNQKMDSLYKDIYISRIDDRQNLDNIINGLDSALDRLQGGSDISISGMSELVRRIDKKQSSNVDQLIDSVSNLFTDNTLIGILASNDSIHKYLAAENYTYDLICKYLPKLKLALEIKRDNVLCSDNFSKDFVNPQSSKSAKEEAQKFAINTKKLERKYEFSDFLDKTYMNVSKYGEDFIYIVPYQVAFKRLIKRGNQRALTGNIYAGNLNILGESYGYSNRPYEVVSEGYILSREFKEYLDVVSEADSTLVGDFIKNNKVDGAGVNLYFNDTGMIQSSVNEYCTLHEATQMNKFKSLSSIYESTAVKEDGNLEKKYKNVNDKNDGLTNAANGIYADGLLLPDELARDPEKIDKNFTGAVVERIPRENIIPVYMGDICFGYYHLEFGKDPTACGFCGGHHNGMPGISNGNLYAKETDERQEELMLRFISAKISAAIDTHFINANKDLKEEIYAILHYNEQFDINRTNNIGVTFIPAEDIVHCYFEMDEYTHRGISDLKDSIVPAMLYILLYLTDIIGKITRSTDKRVYYVKQNVEQNVARTMMNVVKQIKKGNLGMRQIESMNNILNIVGKYNDFIIPQGPSGDPPVQFEIMPGQDIQTPTEIMDKMEESAINPIMPFEFLNSVMQQDFATRFTMSNTRFLKTIFTRQHKTEMFATKMYTKIYNFEFDEHYQEIEIVLPPPTYLVISNNAQLIDNVEQMADKITLTYLDLEPDEVKAEFKKNYVRDALSTYIDYDKVERFIQVAKVNIEAEMGTPTDDGADADMYT